jgi:hypothetical protein
VIPVIPGTPVVLGDREYTVPPLTWPQALKLAPELALIHEAHALWSSKEVLRAYLAIITAALRRNYPDLTEDKIAEIIDFGNCIALLRAVLGTPVSPNRELSMMPPKGTRAN